MDQNDTSVDCTKLVGRMRQICEGTSGLSPEIEQQYRDHWAGNPPAPPPEPPSLACVHRGEQIDWVDCPTCQNKTVKLKVFGCGLHSQCVMTNDLGKLKGCVGCGSRLEKSSE